MAQDLAHAIFGSHPRVNQVFKLGTQAIKSSLIANEFPTDFCKNHFE
jgi:hypothetical protein